jgi:hypothetical protein
VSKINYDGVVGHFMGTYAVFKQGSKKFLATVTGREIDVSECDSVEDFDGETIIGAIIKNHQKEFFYMDDGGNKISDETFAVAKPYRENFAIVKTKDFLYTKEPFFFIDWAGNHLSDKTFEKVKDFSEGLAAVKSGYGGWNFIDQYGDYISQTEYEEAQSFSEGFAVVKDNGWYFLIDREGRVLGDKKFTYASGFKDGKASVMIDNEDYEIDGSGQLTKKESPRRRGGRSERNRDSYYRGSLMLNPDIFDEV